MKDGNKNREADIIAGNTLIAKYLGLVRKPADESYALPQWYRKKGGGLSFFGYDDSLGFNSDIRKMQEVLERLQSDDRVYCYSLEWNKETQAESFTIHTSQLIEKSKQSVFRNEGDNCIWKTVVQYLEATQKK